MHDLSFHPQWEHREFNKEEYQTLFSNLANKKSNTFLMSENHSLKVVGKIMCIWQLVREFFGFENKVNSVKVNYELLKILRYGETHGFFHDPAVLSLLEKLQITFSKDKDRQEITMTINRIVARTIAKRGDTGDEFLDIDGDIELFSRVHKKELSEPFWSKIFHRILVYQVLDQASVYKNLGQIHLANHEYIQAIENFKKAVYFAPNKPEWQISLAIAYQKQAEAISVKDSTESVGCYKKSLTILQSIPSQDSWLAKKIDSARRKALVNLLVLQIQSNRVEDALQTMQEHLKETNRDIDLFHSSEEALNNKLTKEQHGRFYLALANSNLFPEHFETYHAAALHSLYISVQQKPDAEISEMLIKACLTAGQSSLTKGDLDGTEERIDEVIYHLQYCQSYFPQIARAPHISQLVSLMHAFAKLQEENNDMAGAIQTLHKIESLTEKNPALLAKNYFSFARIERTRGGLYPALVQAEKAYALNPKIEYRELSGQLASEIAANSADQLTLQAPETLLPEIISSLESLSKSQPDQFIWAALLAKAQMAQIEHLCILQKFSEAKALAAKNMAQLGKLIQKGGPELNEGMRLLFGHASLLIFSIQLKINDLNSAVKTLKNAIQATKQSGTALLENYFADFILTTSPSQVQLGQFYLLLAHDREFQFNQNDFLRQAIIFLNGSLSEKFDELVYEQLILANIELSQHLFSKNELEESEASLNKAIEHYRYLKHEGSPHAPCLPSLYSKIMMHGNNLVEKLIARADKSVKNEVQELAALKSAINATRKLKDLAVQMPGEFASQSYTLALLERRSGNFYAAMTEAEQAKIADPSNKKYIALVDQLAGETEIQSLLAENYLKEKQYDKALKCYLNCYKKEIENSPNLTGDVIAKLIELADKVKDQNSTLAAKAYESAISYLGVHDIPDQKKLAIYHFLGLEHQKYGNYTRAIEYFEKILLLSPRDKDVFLKIVNCYKVKGDYKNAITLLQKAALILWPEDASLSLFLAQLYEEQNRFEDALKIYYKLFSTNPDNDEYRKKIILTETQAGDDYFFKKKCTPDELRQSVIALVQFALDTAQPWGKFLHSALQPGLLDRLKRNNLITQLQMLGRKEKVQDIVQESEFAIQVIDKASLKLKNEDDRARVNGRVQEIRIQISRVMAYYIGLQKSINELLETARSEGVAKEEFANWADEIPMKKISEAENIKKRAEKVLNILDPMLASSKVVSPKLSSQVENLRLILKSFSLPLLAIPHYLKACELSRDHYGEHINKLIEAYIQGGYHEEAIAAYNKYKVKFPDMPIKIEVAPYLALIENKIGIANKGEEAIDLAFVALSIFPNNKELKQSLSRAYHAVGSLHHKKENYIEAKKYYEKAINCGEEAQAECYAGFAKLLHDISNKCKENTAVSKKLNSQIDTGPFWNLIGDYLKKAADLAPNKAKYQFQAGKYAYTHSGMKYNCQPYFKRAVERDKTNKVYAHGYLMSQSDDMNSPEFLEALRHFRSLGAEITGEDYGLTDDSLD